MLCHAFKQHALDCPLTAYHKSSTAHDALVGKALKSNILCSITAGALMTSKRLALMLVMDHLLD